MGSESSMSSGCATPSRSFPLFHLLSPKLRLKWNPRVQASSSPRAAT
jgi:hypothetical protein